MQALVSVIIPAYNYAAFLPETVASIRAQSWQNWECIIIDDGSTDNTHEVAEQLCREDKRIRYFLQKNSGPALARNLGLSKAEGEFIQFIDADDLIEEKKFEKQLEVFAAAPECDLVYGDVRYFRNGNKAMLFDNITLEGSSPWMKKISGKGEEMIAALLKENLMVIHAPLFRSSLLSRFGNMNGLLYFNEDWELWARFAIGNACFRYDEAPGTLSLVRVHESYSKDNFKMYLYGLYASISLNKRVHERKYRKIMQPKINYHMRILDEKLIRILRTDKKKAVEWALFISRLTGLKRYSFYSGLFSYFPASFCFIISRMLFITQKIKNKIVYA